MCYYVYILVNAHHNVMYVGMTDDLKRRLQEHTQKVFIGFTQQYNVDKLVYYEIVESLEAAIAREKQLKKWSRKKKNALVNHMNPLWNCLTPRFNNASVAEHINYNMPTDGDPSSPLSRPKWRDPQQVDGDPSATLGTRKIQVDGDPSASLGMK